MQWHVVEKGNGYTKPLHAHGWKNAVLNIGKVCSERGKQDKVCPKREKLTLSNVMAPHASSAPCGYANSANSELTLIALRLERRRRLFAKVGEFVVKLTPNVEINK